MRGSPPSMMVSNPYRRGSFRGLFRCLLLAQSGHSTTEFRCPLLRVKWTLIGGDPMSAFDPKRTSTTRFPPEMELLQPRGVLVNIGGGEDWEEGDAGDSTNVSHTFQPSGLLSLSNSPYPFRFRYPCMPATGKIYPICGPIPMTRDLKGHNTGAQPLSPVSCS